ncbi:G-protein coupled receptors family 1 profile domain-containing protein [Caenorhabditis elegans]|uniref:G-protein coupled receptors family 1 profile domain-containing protein n=1 Tax=Caenorhabditis elegans TaxID=6239 RepID=Q17672_CAEEL|nr:G-protein coupled receptors family 1 profile domain-containing protein [Caenorhabditis elegans]CAA91789.3 G-protein coupled receptors family 1 profile domain-containing protein [Caenorhabditis elegans]|eukprot:NP_510154.3 FMRFamide Peptide Receptor family [Caenorhabditis elegans]
MLNHTVVMRECECLHEPIEGYAGVANLLLIVISLPLISFVGVVLNFFNIFIFCDQKNTAAKYLTALSCSDVGVCMAGIFVICSDSLRAHSFVIDQVFVFLLPKIIPLGLFFQMLSVYITVLAAFDCFYSVYCGTKCEPKRSTWAPRVLALVVISVAGYNIVQFGDLQAIECLHPDNYTLFELCPTEMRVSETYVIVYKGYLYALSMAFLPFVLLTFLTVSIIVMLRRKNETMHMDKAEKEECEDDGGNNPVVLLLVVLLFLCCNLTSLLVNVFEMLKFNMAFETEAVLIDIGNFLVVINATANFFVYMGSSEEFRSSFYQRIRQLWRPKSTRLPLLHDHRIRLFNRNPVASSI